MRILVTGANGQVGYELSQLAISSEHTWRCLDRAGLDISSQTAVDAIVDDYKPEVVINAAAYTAVDKAESEQALARSINTEACEYLAKACERHQSVFIHISTDYVFTGDLDRAYVETDPVGPTGVYGQTKLDGEIAIEQHCHKHIILRTAWVFGQHGNNFVKTMLRLGKERSELGIVADQHGAPTSAKGIAECCLSMIDAIDQQRVNNPWGIYHFSGAPFTTWYGFAEEIFKQAKQLNLIDSILKLNAISSDQFPTPAKRPANSKLNCSKLAEIFSIETDDWRFKLKEILEYSNNDY
jgi:dTDP-4-dehydrorhamnose reductase